MTEPSYRKDYQKFLSTHPSSENVFRVFKDKDKDYIEYFKNGTWHQKPFFMKYEDNDKVVIEIPYVFYTNDAQTEIVIVTHDNMFFAKIGDTFTMKYIYSETPSTYTIDVFEHNCIFGPFRINGNILCEPYNDELKKGKPLMNVLNVVAKSEPVSAPEPAPESESAPEPAPEQKFVPEADFLALQAEFSALRKELLALQKQHDEFRHSVVELFKS